MPIKTIDAFQQEVRAITESGYYPGSPDAFALGLVRRAGDGSVLDVRFPTVNYRENDGSAAILYDRFYRDKAISAIALQQLILHVFYPFRTDGTYHPNIAAIETLMHAATKPFPNTGVMLVWIQDLSKPPASTEDAWLRLHLLSHRKVTPNSINLDGIFGLLTNVAWTSAGPMLPDTAERHRISALYNEAPFSVESVDKFPPMLNYVIPSGVRITDGTRVRLGAYLAPGTTVMHEGFVNFNAGTLGTSMVEGRISQGVTVGNGSDIGGGASIMGTLSGGGTHKVSIGEHSLLGANAGLGISIGHNTIVEAGLYITAGSKVLIPRSLGIPELESRRDARGVLLTKAADISGISGVIIRRNSLSGAIEVIENTNGTPELNMALHAN